MIKKALIVDDSRLARVRLKRLLQDYDIDVYEAEGVLDGEEVIRRDVLPDLVFMDVMMPDLDGFEGLRRLRENEETRAVPVVMYSGDISEESRNKARSQGATGYLPKPADPKRLEHLISSINKRLQGSVAVQESLQVEVSGRSLEEDNAEPVFGQEHEEVASYGESMGMREKLGGSYFSTKNVVEQTISDEAYEELLRRLGRVEERVSLQDSSIAHMDLSANLEAQRRDIVYLQRQLTKLEQWVKIAMAGAGLATLIALASLIRQLL